MTLSGILNIDKPRGWTSFDVVKFVRGHCGERRVGHAGTLDPAATGVLPVLIGQATRLTEYLVDTTKEYMAEVELGLATDTYDAEGEVTSRADASSITEIEVAEALSRFRGEILQAPPVYSALKQDGVPLYKRARRGEEVRADPRQVMVEELDIIAFEAPWFKLQVVCGKGFYVRSLAHDLGARLGVGGMLSGLERRRVGTLGIEDAVDIETLRREFENGEWLQRLIAPDEVLLGWQAAIFDGAGLNDVMHGRETTLTSTGAQSREGAHCRAYSGSGDFLAVLRCREGNQWRAEKVFTGGVSSGG